MGLTQSDEYCETYDRFMEEYDLGKEPADIAKEILGEYLAEFGSNSGILHDVYFAIAKAQWMCQDLSPEIRQKVSEIIESDANITFLRELSATEADLKIRKKNLHAFWHPWKRFGIESESARNYRRSHFLRAWEVYSGIKSESSSMVESCWTNAILIT